MGCINEQLEHKEDKENQSHENVLLDFTNDFKKNVNKRPTKVAKGKKSAKLPL